MLSDTPITFSRDDLDRYLWELAREYRRRNKKAPPAEIILVGGAAIIANYNFRDMTSDIDAFIRAEGSMKEAINAVGDKYNLPNGWINDDFRHTSSFSRKLSQYSEYFKEYYHALEVRTIGAEYLIAMKLRSGRIYKNDLSDIVGILAEHAKRGTPITREQIETAVINLYDSAAEIPENSRTFLDNILRDNAYLSLYDQTIAKERNAKDVLQLFDTVYPNLLRDDNAAEIAESVQSRRSILELLEKKKTEAAAQPHRKKNIDRSPER